MPFRQGCMLERLNHGGKGRHRFKPKCFRLSLATVFHELSAAGETSQLRNAFSPWDTTGYSTEARFKGVLAALSNGTKFAGRQVQETPQSLIDGCNQITGTGDRVVPVTAADINGLWNMQND